MKKTSYWTIPNLLTSLRIVCAVTLAFLQPMSAPFFAFYTVCGLTDVFDGMIARATGKVTEFGAKLDSIADLLFYGISLVKIIPYLWTVLMRWIWFAAGGVLLLRSSAYLAAGVKFHRFSAMHTYLNKLTGFTVFCIPYFCLFVGADCVCIACCIVGGLGSAEELMIHLVSPVYNPGCKTIFRLSKQNTAA